MDRAGFLRLLGGLLDDEHSFNKHMERTTERMNATHRLVHAGGRYNACATLEPSNAVPLSPCSTRRPGPGVLPSGSTGAGTRSALTDAVQTRPGLEQLLATCVTVNDSSSDSMTVE